jgi:hypothetical protein
VNDGGAQSRRLAAHRKELLECCAYTVAELARVRGEDLADTRPWLAGQNGDQTLFVVQHDGQQLVPAFLLTVAGEPVRHLQPLLAVLAEAGVGGWTAWTFLSSRTALLGGDVPPEVAAADCPTGRRCSPRWARCVPSTGAVGLSATRAAPCWRTSPRTTWVATT